MFEHRNAQIARLGLVVLCLIVCGSVASAQETGGDLVGGAGIFRPKNPEAKRSSGPKRPPRPTMTPAEIEDKYQDWIVARGGSYSSTSNKLSGSMRDWFAPNYKNPNLGFRLVKASQ